MIMQSVNGWARDIYYKDGYTFLIKHPTMMVIIMYLANAKTDR